jgi:hypothetical protein
MRARKACAQLLHGRQDSSTFLSRATRVDLKSSCEVGGHYGKRNVIPHCAIDLVLASREWKAAATFAHHWIWFVRKALTLVMWRRCMPRFLQTKRLPKSLRADRMD